MVGLTFHDKVKFVSNTVGFEGLGRISDQLQHFFHSFLYHHTLAIQLLQKYKEDVSKHVLHTHTPIQH